MSANPFKDELQHRLVACEAELGALLEQYEADLPEPLRGNRQMARALRRAIHRSDRTLTDIVTGKKSVGNQRNVEALKALLMDTSAYKRADDIAEFLTERGVLVPSTLTDDETFLLGAGSDQQDFRNPNVQDAADMRAGLEKIARGEA